MGLWSVYLTNLHDNFNHILSYMLLFLKLLLSLTLMNDTLTYDAAGFILDPYETIFEDPTYREIFINKIVQITSTGFTIDEFQKTMVLLCLIRFVIYSIKYNIITSFKMCAIGSFSCLLWAAALNDCVGAYFPVLQFNPLLKRIQDEEQLFRQIAQGLAVQRINTVMLNRMTGDIYHFEWLGPLFRAMPESIAHYTDPIYEYVRTDFYDVARKFYKLNIRQLLPFVAYTTLVRIGKKYCPYHVRWHFTFIILYNQIVGFVYEGAGRAQAMITYTLLPQFRFEEAQTVQLYLGTLALVHMGAIMLAMLHCIFSQYFYVPMFTYGAELHCGKRPKNSIYSGGYTAWQDVYTFYDLKFRESMRLWWGWLGRGTKAMRKKNGEDKKKRKRKKK